MRILILTEEDIDEISNQIVIDAGPSSYFSLSVDYFDDSSPYFKKLTNKHERIITQILSDKRSKSNKLYFGLLRSDLTNIKSIVPTKMTFVKPFDVFDLMLYGDVEMKIEGSKIKDLNYTGSKPF